MLVLYLLRGRRYKVKEELKKEESITRSINAVNRQIIYLLILFVRHGNKRLCQWARPLVLDLVGLDHLPGPCCSLFPVHGADPNLALSASEHTSHGKRRRTL